MTLYHSRKIWFPPKRLTELSKDFFSNRSGLPNVFESRKHRHAPRTVENQDRTLPQMGPKTKAFVSLVKGHTDAKKVLLISDSFDENFCRSARNVKPVLLATAADVNTEQLLAFDKIIVTEKALAQLAERMTRS